MQNNDFPSQQWDRKQRFINFFKDTESSIDELLGEERKKIEAEKKGKSDGFAKKAMDPRYAEMIQTEDNHEIGMAYAQGYKDGRERAYRKTGSNRRRKTKKLRKSKKQTKKLNLSR